MSGYGEGFSWLVEDGRLAVPACGGERQHALGVPSYTRVVH